ncbi:MAG: NTP transferase domain-containing protein [Deltaproteobacteria bacterium]|jgi:mannose-1-phosphate guanylyltransferase|nr:NTP transferase domain-containing protein [Deltaproteobacteria bacterium]MBT6432891.1 NTP transferase domain-containing protein [Deltaproteobacteria bacterium]
MQALNHLRAVVLAGGSGTRFWPLSRPHRPKQLLDLSGQGILLWQTFDRIQPVVAPKHWWMVVGAAHAQGCHDVVPDVSSERVLVEPCARNTAAAIGLAALHLVHEDPDAMMVILPADHHVRDSAAFCEALDLAARAAAKSGIVTLGIKPSRPETGYGYIEAGKESGLDGVFQVSSFKEKPDLKTAQSYLDSGNFLWNAGVFIVRADYILNELKVQQIELHRGLMKIGEHIGTDVYDAQLASIYETLPSVSIDYAVMENAHEVSVIPLECGWSDVGSLGSLDGVLQQDEDNNLIMGNTVVIDTRDCTLIADEDHVVAAIGLRDLVVVHTRDATLVMPKERAQEVRQVVAMLKEKGWNE